MPFNKINHMHHVLNLAAFIKQITLTEKPVGRFLVDFLVQYHDQKPVWSMGQYHMVWDDGNREEADYRIMYKVPNEKSWETLLMIRIQKGMPDQEFTSKLVNLFMKHYSDAYLEALVYLMVESRKVKDPAVGFFACFREANGVYDTHWKMDPDARVNMFVKSTSRKNGMVEVGITYNTLWYHKPLGDKTVSEVVPVGDLNYALQVLLTNFYNLEEV